ncbi:hypothetical protein FGO68_gene4721 [Halteria grandinella]|uniref:Uncharacterized protein n=1 Tax=Halteria grandinella TaxID=5974 RepID=A0A8J8NG84_HALGN|nr:hypothetical protein FGO68_gene4721 [Halteria grandinella]
MRLQSSQALQTVIRTCAYLTLISRLSSLFQLALKRTAISTRLRYTHQVDTLMEIQWHMGSIIRIRGQLIIILVPLCIFGSGQTLEVLQILLLQKLTQPQDTSFKRN